MCKFYLQILTLFLSVSTHLLTRLEIKLGERGWWKGCCRLPPPSPDISEHLLPARTMLSASCESSSGISEQHQGVFLIAGEPGSDWLGNLYKVHCGGSSSSPGILEKGVFTVILDEEAPEVGLINSMEKCVLIAEEGQSCELEGGRPGPRGRQDLDRRPESIWLGKGITLGTMKSALGAPQPWL